MPEMCSRFHASRPVRARFCLIVKGSGEHEHVCGQHSNAVMQEHYSQRRSLMDCDLASQNLEKTLRKALERRGNDMPKTQLQKMMVRPEPLLSAVIGAGPISRSEATKLVWDYIKKHGLQDATNRRMINADELLKPIFEGRAQVSMFEMTAMFSRHLTPVKA